MQRTRSRYETTLNGGLGCASALETAVQRNRDHNIKLGKKVRRKKRALVDRKYIYMIADELARARDACDALRSDDPLRPEMRTRLEMTCAGDARPHAMRIWGVVVGCVLAGLVFAVAAAAVEVCNDGHCVKRAWHASRSGRTLWRRWCVREMGGPELRREAHLQAHAARREVVGQACMRVERHVVGGS